MKKNQKNTSEMAVKEMPSSSPTAYNYYYPNTLTLINEHGIKDRVHLEKLCAHTSAQALINLRQEPLPEKLDSSYLRHVHHQLFKDVFAWAGQTRDIPFIFPDGRAAHIPTMQKSDPPVIFATGSEIQEVLKRLDQELEKRNYLQGLSREEFAQSAATLFSLVNYAHPFREGNGRTQRAFFEKIAEGAGYELDFSLVTKERMATASIAALTENDFKPLQHMFEDISNPEKQSILREFMDHMKNLKDDTFHNQNVVVAEEGKTYQGICKGDSDNSFFVATNDKTIVVEKKENVTLEFVKGLTRDASVSFVSSSQQADLIPAEKIKPLSEDSMTRILLKNPQFRESLHRIEELSKIVYGDPAAVHRKVDLIRSDPDKIEEMSAQVYMSPKSVARLSGRKIIFFSTPARKHSKNKVHLLSFSLESHGRSLKNLRESIIKNYTEEKERKSQSVAAPSEKLQSILKESIETQKELLSSSPELQQEVDKFMQAVVSRLSKDELEAVEQCQYGQLAKSLGTSLHRAQEITQIINTLKEGYALATPLRRDILREEIPSQNGDNKVVKLQHASVSRSRQEDSFVAEVVDSTLEEMQDDFALQQSQEISARRKTSPLTDEIEDVIARMREVASIVYGDPDALNGVREQVVRNPSLGDEVARVIERSPQIVKKLAGKKNVFGKDSARKIAEDHVCLLSSMVSDYADIVRDMQKEAIFDSHSRQQDSLYPIKKPSNQLYELLFTQPQYQEKILLESPVLQAELVSYMQFINDRFSPTEYEAVKRGDPEKFAKMFGISDDQAKNVVRIIHRTQEVHQMLQISEVHSLQVDVHSPQETRHTQNLSEDGMNEYYDEGIRKLATSAATNDNVQKTEEKDVLIPDSIVTPLSKREIDKKICGDICVKANLGQIWKLSEAVYGHSEALDEKMILIHQDPRWAKHVAQQIESFPGSIADLAGKCFFAMKTQARKQAEDAISLLCTAVANHADIVTAAHEKVIDQHQKDVEQLGNAVPLPSDRLNNLFALQKQQQRKVLSQDPALKKELYNYMTSFQNRLSQGDYKAIQNNDFEALSVNVGVSIPQAEKIAEVFKCTREAQKQTMELKLNRQQDGKQVKAMTL
ncbi:BID domain-containing T4SS effector [Bartonella ancashensis]|uniref:protein adenylyltransferase n=1 Tax=Bartonella ancashensis TaxID=1318743 RepID=A0A0M3T2K6_9HYPH|nr:BID domain-containing T4SS effector [Bartonella ancashensis]ALE03011.1 hypothetical protein PU02_0197 [Bartonella ancashensis]ARE31017.1 Bep197 [Bartonella ancashensis]